MKNFIVFFVVFFLQITAIFGQSCFERETQSLGQSHLSNPKKSELSLSTLTIEKTSTKATKNSESSADSDASGCCDQCLNCTPFNYQFSSVQLNFSINPSSNKIVFPNDIYFPPFLSNIIQPPISA